MPVGSYRLCGFSTGTLLMNKASRDSGLATSTLTLDPARSCTALTCISLDNRCLKNCRHNLCRFSLFLHSRGPRMVASGKDVVGYRLRCRSPRIAVDLMLGWAILASLACRDSRPRQADTLGARNAYSPAWSTDSAAAVRIARSAAILPNDTTSLRLVSVDKDSAGFVVDLTPVNPRVRGGSVGVRVFRNGESTILRRTQ